MRLVTFRATVEAPARLGAIAGSLVVDLELLGDATGVPLPSTMLDFIDLGPEAVRIASALMAELDGEFPLGTAQPLANVKLLAPIPRPRKNIFGIGLNYIDHVAESAAALDTSPDLPRQPVIFSKPPTSVIGPGDPIPHDANVTQQLDWEVELAAVIGTRAKRVAREDALACARRLIASGVKPEERIALVAETGPEFAALFFGVVYAGAWPVPLPLPTSFGGRDSYIEQLRVQRFLEVRDAFTHRWLREA